MTLISLLVGHRVHVHQEVNLIKLCITELGTEHTDWSGEKESDRAQSITCVTLPAMVLQ